MAKKDFFKLTAVITCLLLQLNLLAQNIPPVTLHVETAGTLPSMIGETRKFQITDLTLTGNLNGTDIRFIREMAGSNSTSGKLAHLNLLGANIVSGGNAYYGYYTYTSNDTITGYMFYGCSQLTSITIPKSVTSIEGHVFYGCYKLASVTIPNGVTSIGSGAFYNCTRLTSITIPYSITSIGSGAFQDCTGLTSITIPSSVTSIGWAAFYNCTRLTSVTIPNSITSIESFTFQGCAGLTSITIPNSVTSIGRDAFQGCARLTSITIPNSVTSIGERAFQDCTGLTSVTLSENVTTISIDVFRGCTGLTSVTIPNSVTSIESSAFYGCTGLTSITIPSSVTSIGRDAFYGCTGLKEIYSRNSIPPSLGSSGFYNVNKTTCKLYVPKGSYMAYWLQWGFDNIIEESHTAIIPIEKENINIQSISNGIAIETTEQTPVSVYNLSAQKLYESVVNGNTEIPLNKGVYIVSVKNESRKVVVK